MKRSHGYLIGGGIAFVVVIIILMATLIPAPMPAPKSCPASYETPPVILVSLDGFRADYIDRGLTPTLKALAEGGVHAPFMRPSYPTLTFPNHYTIVTGMYPESHGIIANKFYDPEFGASFSMGNDESLKGRWWGGEPIWNTLDRQGKKSATYFWPGSEADIDGKHPTYWFPYSDDALFGDRVQQVIDWIKLPEVDRPAWISVYFNEPDHTGHGEGPDANQVDALVVYVDMMIQRLLDGLEDLGLQSCVNLIIVADHGMASSSEAQIIKLADYIPNLYDLAYTYSGAFGRLDLKSSDEAIETEMLKNLTCQREELRAYDYHDLPTRFHFSNNRRIEDIVLDLNVGYTVSVSSDWYLDGQHGYDNYEETMNALFIANGPAFQPGKEIEPFQNIELYNLMCLLTGVEPAPNNGTEGSLYHALVNPPQWPVLPPEGKPPTSSYPSSSDVEARLDLSGCPGDLTAVESWMESLNLSPAQQEAAESSHFPWGIPHSAQLNASLTLLHHTDHVTAFSDVLKMPLFTSATISGVQGTVQTPLWCSDVRLVSANSPTCAEYDNANATMAPLFPPSFLADPSLDRVPFMVSNAVPVASQLADRWTQLVTELVPSWVSLYGSLNVVMGPVFDNNADSFVDDFESFATSPEMPSDLFAVITRCETQGTPVDQCSVENLDVLSFIFPESIKVSNCLNSTRFALEFSAKVDDVQKVTGLTFYPSLAFEDRTRLQLSIHSSLWPLE